MYWLEYFYNTYIYDESTKLTVAFVLGLIGGWLI